MIHLDTHVVAWLFAGRTDLLTPRVRALMDAEPWGISPMVVLELQYLFELGRTTKPAKVVLEALARETGLKLCDLPFDQVIEHSLDQDWTRDPFDRVIVAQAAVRGVPLVTKDRTIRAHYRRSVWGGASTSRT